MCARCVSDFWPPPPRGGCPPLCVVLKRKVDYISCERFPGGFPASPSFPGEIVNETEARYNRHGFTASRPFATVLSSSVRGTNNVRAGTQARAHAATLAWNPRPMLAQHVRHESVYPPPGSSEIIFVTVIATSGFDWRNRLCFRIYRVFWK